MTGATGGTVVVVDTSALLDLLLRVEHVPRLADRLLAPRSALHVPHLVDVEIAHALRRLVREGRVSAARAAQALEVLASLRLRRWPHLPLLGRAWSLRDNLTAYDATYVALAESLEVPLVTRDRHLAAAPGLRASVELY